MRTTKRFTPHLLDRYSALDRGIGTFEHYLPWHRVTRSDPASKGRSHLLMWRGRQREFLSDGEWVVCLFITMMLDVVDMREQFPLRLGKGRHELSDYDIRVSGHFPGTLDIASALGYKHPMIHGNGRSVPWIMSSDFLLCLRQPDGKQYLLAISVKPNVPLEVNRTRKLLEIERAYWRVRGVDWLLITPSLYQPEVAFRLRDNYPWALGDPAAVDHIKSVTHAVQNHYGLPQSSFLQRFALEFGSMDLAQRAFWQAVWSCQIPLDLRRGWRPHSPVLMLNPEQFWALNPVASRRTSWS